MTAINEALEIVSTWRDAATHLFLKTPAFKLFTLPWRSTAIYLNARSETNQPGWYLKVFPWTREVPPLPSLFDRPPYSTHRTGNKRNSYFVSFTMQEMMYMLNVFVESNKLGAHEHFVCSVLHFLKWIDFLKEWTETTEKVWMQTVLVVPWQEKTLCLAMNWRGLFTCGTRWTITRLYKDETFIISTWWSMGYTSFVPDWTLKVFQTS